MNRIEATREIRQLGLTKTLIARLSGIAKPDFIGWTLGKLDLSEDKLKRIAESISALRAIIQDGEQLGISYDLRNAESVQRLIARHDKLKADPLIAAYEGLQMIVKAVQAAKANAGEEITLRSFLACGLLNHIKLS